MELKQCPECRNYSVSYDYHRGVEMCRQRDCTWVNTKHVELKSIGKTIITLRKSRSANGTSVAAEGRLPD